jgi:hypothetical protein
MGKFELVTLDKTQVVGLVNAVGAEVSQAESKSVPAKIYAKAGALLNGLIFGNDEKSLALKAEISKLGLDSHEGRKEFLSQRLGIDPSTADDYRLAVYTNDAGQVTLFRGRMDGDKKLVLTDSLAFPDRPDKLHELFQSNFKPLPKPIEVPLEKSTVTPEGTKLDVLPEEQKKLETQSTLAAAIHKSGDVQLTSNARLPGKPQTPSAGLNA